jgi:hypothetical protein
MLRKKGKNIIYERMEDMKNQEHVPTDILSSVLQNASNLIIILEADCSTTINLNKNSIYFKRIKA